jgi:hypothetical protein
MTKVYKTARGKTIDMDKVKLANESVTAVGNMKVNARGDKLGVGGQVVAGRNQLMDRVYNIDESSAPKSGGYSPNDPAVFAKQQALIEANKARDLHNLATNLVRPTSVEPVEPTEESTVEPTARGSLASSVAKTAVVTQELLPDPKKSNGPTRI